MSEKKILVVDDEVGNGRLLEARLGANGFNVKIAVDGLEGLNMARSESPDLIILDVNMPKMDGYQVCRMLKFDDQYKSIPIIMLTDRAEDCDREIGQEVEADSYMTKPFDEAKLLVEIDRLLKNDS